MRHMKEKKGIPGENIIRTAGCRLYNHILNELLAREFDVDVGVVEYNRTDESAKKVRVQPEIDFVLNKGSKRYYIQSALSSV